MKSMLFTNNLGDTTWIESRPINDKTLRPGYEEIFEAPSQDRRISRSNSLEWILVADFHSILRTSLCNMHSRNVVPNESKEFFHFWKILRDYRDDERDPALCYDRAALTIVNLDVSILWWMVLKHLRFSSGVRESILQQSLQVNKSHTLERTVQNSIYPLTCEDKCKWKANYQATSMEPYGHTGMSKYSKIITNY